MLSCAHEIVVHYEFIYESQINVLEQIACICWHMDYTPQKLLAKHYIGLRIMCSSLRDLMGTKTATMRLLKFNNQCIISSFCFSYCGYSCYLSLNAFIAKKMPIYVGIFYSSFTRLAWYHVRVARSCPTLYAYIYFNSLSSMRTKIMH